ncbi:ABC transporter ATP-binding protein [Mycoplasmatota bacterium]|nr:ABC transporter ATP-binding protein [Mycoplasmatota bacterium]
MLRKFISYYKPHKKLFILDIGSAFLAAGIDLIFPMATRTILDDVIPKGNIRTLYILAGTLVFLFILRALLNYIVDYWGHVLGTRMQHDMRKDLFKRFQKLSFKYYDKNKTGNLMSRIVNDLFQISELAHHGPEDIFLSFILLIGSFIILVTINWKLTLIMFAFIPIMLLFGIKKRRKIGFAFKSIQKKIAEVNSQIENSISGIRVTKSFTNEKYEIEKFGKGNREFKEANEFAFKSVAELGTGISLISNILNVIVLTVGGYLVYSKAMRIGDLVAYLLYTNYFFKPIMRLIAFTQQYEAGMAGFERFIEVLNTEPEILDKEDAFELKNIRGSISVNNVTFGYNEKVPILSDISIHIQKGKTLALVGPSGGGKSTLCHLIPRFYDVDNGKIMIDGIDIKDVTQESLRRNIGLVSQDVFLFTGTIKENILYGNPAANDEEIIDAAKKAEIHEFITRLPEGYNTYIGEKGVKLSGGQKQRISIARVFLKNPSILILDEATSALDNETESKIQKSLEILSVGRTTLVIAHRLSTIQNADEIVVLTKEGIIERGKHEELIIRSGLYSKLYNSQFKEKNSSKIA